MILIDTMESSCYNESRKSADTIYCPASGEPVKTISGLGRWPKAASMEYFHENHDGDLPAGILRTVMPAAPDGWLTALARFGTMMFEEVVQPALELFDVLGQNHKGLGPFLKYCPE